MTYYSRRRAKDTIALVAVGLLGVGIIAAIIWWHLTYRCVSQHYEWRTSCTVHRDSQGRRTGETCHERRVEVCDSWEER